MGKKKVSIIVSNIEKSLAFEWIGKHLNHDSVDLSFVLINSNRSPLQEFLYEHNILCYNFKYDKKSELPIIILSLIRFFRATKPDIVHCHLFDASLIGLLAGRIAGVKKRIYTRHHSTYNHIYNKKGVYFDMVINSLATDIVAISKNVEKVLIEKEKVDPKKITLIHHGFDLKAFASPDKQAVQALMQKHNPEGKGPVIGVIARWIEWKGIQYVIPAFKSLLNEYPNALLILANAKGPYANNIKGLLSELPTGSYQLIDFEHDLFALYHLFDIYVHVPVDPEIEAFGQTYVEALAAGVPSVFTLSGIAKEFVEHERNASVVPYTDSDAIYNSIKLLLAQSDLRNGLIENGKKDVVQFKLDNMINELEQLYLAGS